MAAAGAGSGDPAAGYSHGPEEFVRRFARTSSGHLSPVAAVVGGVAAQEAVKAISRKNTPLSQLAYFDFSEALPDELPPAEERKPKGDRYDGQRAVFGEAVQRKLGSTRAFLVGAGAIGCEVLKSWALMGVGCGEQGKGKGAGSAAAAASGAGAGGPAESTEGDLSFADEGCGPGGMVHVTDMDHIEKSNLSRQFLFRAGDIGSPKSVTAAAAARRMNPSMRVRAHEQPIGGTTEDYFRAPFWKGLDVVCTALDNVQARLYADTMCVRHLLPMLESGTSSTKGNTQIVVPHLTENYGAQRDPPATSFPVCTVKQFPGKIEHTLQWAREWFEEHMS